MKRSIKKIWAIVVAVFFWCSPVIVFAVPEESSIIQCVSEYVEELIFTLDYQNESSYSQEQFDSIEGYILARNFMIQRDAYRHISEKGIHDIVIEGIHVSSIDMVGSDYEVLVSVDYHYLFNGAIDCYTHESYRIKVVEENNRLYCTDISNRRNELVNEILFEITTLGITDQNEKVAYVNDYFAKLERNIQDTPKQNIYQTTEEVYGLTSGFKAVKKMSMHLQRNPYSYHSNIRFISVMF